MNVNWEEKGKKTKTDKENNFKNYTVGKNFEAEEERYNELKAKGFVEEGREVITESDE